LRGGSSAIQPPSVALFGYKEKVGKTTELLLVIPSTISKQHVGDFCPMEKYQISPSKCEENLIVDAFRLHPKILCIISKGIRKKTILTTCNEFNL